MRTRISLAIFFIFTIFSPGLSLSLVAQPDVPLHRARVGIVGLDHDHVWELLKYIAGESQANLVGIADNHSDLVNQAKSQIPATVKFYAPRLYKNVG
jgi:hypothetical protein